jgi:hypothetical protein
MQWIAANVPKTNFQTHVYVVVVHFKFQGFYLNKTAGPVVLDQLIGLNPERAIGLCIGSQKFWKY